MKMVVSDLDGTLLKSDRTISRRTLQTLAGLTATNILFVIATARAHRNVYKLIPLALDNLYLICYNGAEIYHGGELIHSEYIKANQVKNIVVWLLEQYPDLRLSLEISNCLYTNFDIQEMPGWLPPFTQVDFRTFVYKPAAKILIDLRAIPDDTKITGKLPKNCSMVITDGGTLGQIAHMEVSKLNAIKSLAGCFSYGLEEVIAFGDDYNDLEMIRECGVGVAMGNAPQAVKDAADIVTLTNDEDGVAVELERIFSGRI